VLPFFQSAKKDLLLASSFRNTRKKGTSRRLENETEEKNNEA
jgi:hypothetical protein